MKDRVPLYPGRVKLEPVAGQENIYDMTRADSPQQVGTKLNKANLLTDETAAKIWPDESERPADPTPNEALAALVRPEKTAVGSYVGTGENGGQVSLGGTTNLQNQCAVVCVGDTLLKLHTTGVITRSDDDGATWTVVRPQQTNLSWSSMCVGDGIVVAVGTNIGAWSTDLVTWTDIALSFPYSKPFIAYGNGVFVISAVNGHFMYSNDGKSFADATVPNSLCGGKVAFGNGVFVCVGNGMSQQSSTAFYSADGRSWSVASLPRVDQFHTSLAYIRNEFIAIGRNGTTLEQFSSPDGKSWVTVSTNFYSAPYNSSSSLYPGALVYDETTDVAAFFFGTNYGDKAGHVQLPLYNNACCELHNNTDACIAAVDGVGRNGKFILAGTSNSTSNSTNGTNVIVDVITPTKILTDFAPKFCVIYLKDGQPNYTSNGYMNNDCLFVTSDQTTLRVNNANTDIKKSVSVGCKEDGVYMYNATLINGQNTKYTYFVAG